MATAGSIVVDLLMRTGSFETDTDRATKKAQKQFKDMERQAKETADAISKSIGGVLSGAVFGIGLGSIFSKFITETRNSQNEQAQLAAVLRSTGEAAGWTQAQLNQMASSLAGVFSEGDINRAQTRLLSYTGVVGEEFPRALQATIDMAARMGVEVEQAAETIGRALDVPSQGLSSLSKQGFRFTDEQKKLVEQLEKTGKVAEAQAIVLSALESSYGGAAEAARNTFGGALLALQNQIDDLMTGDDASVSGLTSGINELTTALGSDETKMAFATFLEGLAKIATKAVQMAADLVTVTDKAGGLIAVLGAFSPGNGIGDLFRSNAENIEKTKQELSDLSAMQDRLNSGAAKWNDYNQKSLDVARRSAEARLTYYQGVESRNEASVFAAYSGYGETGGSAPTLSPVRVTGSASSGKGAKEKVDQGQRLIDQMNQRIALIGKETEYEKLLEQVRIGSVKFKTEAQRDEALASAQTLDFINEQNKAYEETQAHLEKMGKVSQETASEMDEFAREAARSIQNSLGDGLYSILSGNFDDIGQKFADTLIRMAADAAAANLAGALFGDYGKSGQIGGLIGSVASSLFGSAITASPNYTSGGTAVGSFDGLSRTFSGGGYTGAGGKYDPAGIVHAGEYVFDADSTRRLGVGFLSRLRGYADGGYVGSPAAVPTMRGGNTNVELINNGTPQKVTGVQRTMDIRGEVISIFVDDLQKNGRSANAVRGVVGA